ncbi:MAG: response regulator, partial [Proteobacteria bacterium]|nr:response regulator [Pseudomonadota bacterium]
AEAGELRGVVAAVSHEMRTPLNAIVGLTDLALGTRLSPRQRDYLTKIRSSAQGLSALIDDILDLSKIEAGRMDLERRDFQLLDVLDAVADLFAGRLFEKPLDLVFLTEDDVPESLIGDALRLRQILINLVGNALKFTDEGEVVVGVHVKDRDGRTVELEFSVRDTGLGITPSKIPGLFQSFIQAEASTTRERGGTGLGLAIAKGLVEMMAGRLRAESEPGAGSTFTFTARFGRRPDAQGGLVVTPVDRRGMAVLVAEGNESAREMMCRILTSLSFSPTAVDSGPALLDRLDRATDDQAFGLAVVDWRLPGGGGVGALRRLRREARWSSLPVVMTTVFGAEGVMDRAEEAGVNAFVFKPVKRSMLGETLLQVLNSPLRGATVAGPQAGDRPEVKRLAGAQVLLVEDNDLNRQVVTELLQGAGLIVHGAADGVRALAAVDGLAFDAVLMDIQMPRLDGYETTRRLRADERHRHLPIIAMTAHAGQVDREMCLQAGMNDHIAKPIDFDRLLAVLDQWIGARDGRRSGPFSWEPEPNRMDVFPGLDLAGGLQKLGGDRALLHKTMRRFKADYARAAAELRSFLEAEDWDAAHHLAHGIKGLAALFAPRLAEAVRALEIDLKSGGTAGLGERLQDFSRALEEVLAAADDLADRGRRPPDLTPERRAWDVDVLRPILGDLAGLIEAEKLEAARLVGRLQDLLDDCGLDDDLERLDDQICDLDFRAAAATLARIALALGVEP